MRHELTKQKFLTESEQVALNETFIKYEKTDFRNVTFLMALSHTGSRVSELLAITAKDLSFEGMSLFIHGSKGSRDRELPLTPYLFNRLKVLSSGLSPEERVFSFGYSNALHIWHTWRPAKKKLHALRHTRAMEIYRRSKDVRLVQKVLGHRFLSTTMIYLDYDYTQEEMRRAML